MKNANKILLYYITFACILTFFVQMQPGPFDIDPEMFTEPEIDTSILTSPIEILHQFSEKI